MTNSSKDKDPQDYDQPVAYDVNGHPLYAHPPRVRVKAEKQTQAVRMIRQDPVRPVIDEETKLKNQRSKQLFPGVDLSEGEYIISAVPRHPIGLFVPFASGVVLISIVLTALFNHDLLVKQLLNVAEPYSYLSLFLPAVAFISFVIFVIYVSYYIFTNNRLFLTNERVIQEIQRGFFSRSEQTASLVNIEDVSFSQNGIVQQIFNYGSIRLTIEGSENIYLFTYAKNPREYVVTIDKAVESFKNGRLVDGG